MSESGGLVEELMGIKGGAEGIQYDAERDRFNMPHCAETNVRDELNANRMVVNGKAIAIASQYPFEHQVEAQLKMIVDNCTPVMIVLASSKDIQNHLMPEYFSGKGTYGEIQTSAKFVDYIDLENTIEAKVFALTISGYKDTIEVPVLHIANWPDHRTVSPETTTKLIELIGSTVAEKRAFHDSNNNPALAEPDMMLPVMHCKAGVGRTGQTLAALAMKMFPELSLQSITKDLRASRNDLMIQTPRQMRTLVKLDELREKPEPVKQAPKPKKPASRRSWRSIFGGKAKEA